MTQTTRKQTEIQQATICRCTDKATKEIFYAVKSDSSDVWYQVRFSHRNAMWTCSCPATKPCKHERAVQEVLKIRRANKAAAMGPGVVEAVKRMQADEDRKLAEANRREAYCNQFSIYA